MNPSAILALIGDLYSQIAALKEENEHLKRNASGSTQDTA